MTSNLAKTLSLWLCLFWAAGSASAQQAKPAAPGDPTQQALQQFMNELQELWLSGLLTYQQKIDLGRLCAQIEAAGQGDRPVPLSLVENKIGLLRQVPTPQQRERIRQATVRRRRASQRNLLATFSMKWPEPLQAKWEQAHLAAEQDLNRELADRRAMQAQVAAYVKANPRLHGGPGARDPDVPPRSGWSRSAAIELYIRQLDFTPYFGQRFDDKVLNDPALNDDQRLELTTLMLAKALDRRIGPVPLMTVFRNLQLTADQLRRIKNAAQAAEAELKNALAGQSVELSNVGEIQQWFRRILEREADWDTLLTTQQKQALDMAERTRKARALIPLSLDEIEPELVPEILKLVEHFEAQTTGIPRPQWGRNMVYQEARLDRDCDILHLVMKSKKLSPRRKGQIAKSALDTCFTTLSRLFPSGLERWLDTWPVNLPVQLAGNPTTVESLTPAHWLRIYQIIARPQIWDAYKEAQLTIVAALIAAQATDGKAIEMQMLREYRINRSAYLLAEAIFADPAFTPLQKLAIHETFWNNVGVYTAYYYALDLDADVFWERLKEMRRMLLFASSAAPYDQLIFSVSDIVERQKTSLKSVKRWTEIGGLFSEEEMNILQGRYDKLMARLDEWGRYQPPDPNEPAEPAAPPADEVK